MKNRLSVSFATLYTLENNIAHILRRYYFEKGKKYRNITKRLDLKSQRNARLSRTTNLRGGVKGSQYTLIYTRLYIYTT